MTAQHDFQTIFTNGVRESGVPPRSKADPSRTSFQDADGLGIWKEIHTDTGGQSSSGSNISFNLLTPSSFEQPHSKSNRPCMEQPAVLLSPSRAGGGGRIALNTTSSNCCARRSPKVPHSPQTINILSPQLRPLEKSPKRTQLHITNPGVTENGGLAPMVNQFTLSPEQTTRPAYDHDVEVHPAMLPPAAAVARSISPFQVKPSSPVTKTMSSSTKLKEKLTKPSAEQAPRPSVSKERSPGRTWKTSVRGATPAMATKTLQNNAARGMTREMNGAFLGNNGRATPAAAACVTVHSSSVPSWRHCSDGDAQAMVVPARDREICQGALSGELERPEVPRRVGGKKVVSTQKSGSYNIFNFRNWGKKKSSGGSIMPKLTTPTESFLESDDLGSMKADSDSIEVLDYTIKTLRYKLEQASQKRATAADEVCALQSALEASEEKCRELTNRCHELELKLSARSSGLWDMELEERNNSNKSDSNNSASYFVGSRELIPAHVTARFQSQDLTPELFLKVFEGAIVSLRKLATAICHHIRENGESATQVITVLLEQHKVGRAVRRMPRNVIVLYFESFLNQVMFESFENVSFEPNGASSIFCPDTLKQQCFQAFQSLRSQEWSSIEKSLSQSSSSAVVVNASFHRFFVVRMELILSQLGKLAELQEISLSLMSAFFHAAKGVWLVHHMAFAFDQPVSIFRVSPAAEFDSRFMQQVTAFEEEPLVGSRSKVGIMLNPGFLVDREIIKCQVYCCSKYE